MKMILWTIRSQNNAFFANATTFSFLNEINNYTNEKFHLCGIQIMAYARLDELKNVTIVS